MSDLKYKTAHPGTSRQHEEDVRKQHEVALILFLVIKREVGVREDLRKRFLKKFKITLHILLLLKPHRIIRNWNQIRINMFLEG